MKQQAEGRLNALSEDLRQSQADLQSSKAELSTAKDQLLQKSKRLIHFSVDFTHRHRFSLISHICHNFSQSELAVQLERVRAEKEQLLKRQQDAIDEKLETESRLSTMSDNLRQSKADLRSSQAAVAESKEQLLEKAKRSGFIPLVSCSNL